MKYRSVFDIIGPVMIGPSSSHTAGAARIGRVARSLFGREPERIIVSFYGSFAETYKATAQMSRLSADCLILIHSTNGLKPLYKLQKLKELI